MEEKRERPCSLTREGQCEKVMLASTPTHVIRWCPRCLTGYERLTRRFH